METKQVATVSASAPTLTDGSQTTLFVDAAGGLYVAGGGTGGGPATIANGADVCEGNTADAAVTTDANGTLSAKLRGIIVILLRMFQLATPIRNQQVGISQGQIVDAGGNAVTVTGNKLDVNASVSLSNYALETGGNIAGLVTQIGAVTASPTANTLMDRVKALLTGIVLAAGSNIVGKVGIDQTTPGTTNAVQANAGTNLNTSLLALEAGGNLAALVSNIGAVTASPTANTLMDRVKQLLTGIVLSAGSAIIGKVGIDQTTPGTTNGASLVAAAAGGTTVYSFLSTAAVQAANIKASAGQVYGLHFFNNSATIAYVRLYNLTTSPITSDTPIWRGMVPANTGGAGHVIPIETAIACGTGIGIRVTAGVADNDATALAANVLMGNVLYK